MLVLFSFCLVVLSYSSLSAQSGYPRGDSFSGGRPSSFQTSQDSLEKPPLSIRYLDINELGFLEDRTDSLKNKDLGVDLLQDDINHLRLGNLYSAVYPVRATVSHNKGQSLGVDSYDLYKEYLTSGVITSPNRAMVKGYYGTRFNDGNRNINLDFSRTFARNITFGFRVFSGKSDGQFNHQASNFNALEFNLVQRSNRDRRRSYAHFSLHKNSEQLNGGVSPPDTVFTGLQGGNLGYPVNNDDTDFSLKNTTFKIGTSITLGVDSIQADVKKVVFAEIGSQKERFLHIEGIKGSYEEAAYLPAIFPSTIDTFRRSNQNIYEKIGIGLKSSKWSLNSSLQVMQNTESQKDTTNTFMNQLFLNVEGSYRVKRWVTSINAYQELGGLHERSVKLKSDWQYKSHLLHLHARNGSEAPGLFQNKFIIGSDVPWDNDFKNQNLLEVGIHYANAKTKTSISLKNNKISNYIYLSPKSEYVQAASDLNIQSAEVKQDFKLAFIKMSNIIYLQSINDKSIIDLPKFSSRHDLSLSISFFKKKLKTRLGSIVWLQESSTLPSFHPFLNDFYFPTTDQKSRFMRISPYIKADISGLEIFIGWDDLERGYYRNRHYFNINGYPSFDSRINLAFRVRLLD